MNRREFLIGLGPAVILPSAIPAMAELEQPVTLDYEAAMAEVIAQYSHDLKAYGNAFLLFTDKFPYVRCCRPWEVYQHFPTALN